MSTVNPPPQPKIPQQFMRDDSLRGYFQSVQKILLQLQIRTGGGGDQVAENTTNIATNADDIDALELRMDAAESDIDTNTSNITANTNEIEFNRRYAFALL